MQTTTNHRLNGQHTNGTTAKASGKAKPKQTTKRTQRKKKFGANQRVALLLGGVAALLVALSVYHLTCGIATLTGSPIALALLLAVGIDIGLVASEVAEVLGHADDEVKRWSRVYMAMATVMSMLLNSYEFAAAFQSSTQRGLWLGPAGDGVGVGPTGDEVVGDEVGQSH
ncbi:MAG TPA: hypothetical protein PKD86_00100 [Gemmatales bacterium]|nr:hypothetical protein [Gemmatales bacterium]